MTQQKLIDSVWEKFSDGDHLRYLAFCDAAKAYADAETKELEEAYAELKSSYEKFYESDAVQHKQILALNAEIKRLREFAQQCFKSPEKLAVIHYFENGEFDYCDLVPLQDAATNALSPAPVTEGKENERQLLKDRYAAISDKIEAIGECHDSEKMEELKHKISDRLDEIGWNSPKNEDQE